MKQNRHSIYTILGFIIVFVVVSIMSIHLLHSYTKTKTQMIDEINQNSNITIEILRNNIANLIESYAINEYDNLIYNEMKYKNIFAIIIEDYNMGKVLGENTYISGKINISNNQIIDFDKNNKGHNNLLKNCYFSHTYDIVSDYNKKIGTISIYISDKVMNEELDKILTEGLINTIAISSLLIITLLLTINLIVLKPISNMIDVIKDSDSDGIPSGDIPIAGSIEIKNLSLSINKMIQAIKKSRLILKENETRLQKLLQISPIAVRIASKGGENVVFANKAYARLLEIDENEIIGKNPKDYYINPNTYSEILKSLENHQNIYDKLINLKINNEIKWVLSSYMNVNYSGENLTLGWFYDVTKERKLQESIIKERNFISAIVENASTIIAVIDNSGVMILLNKYAQNFTGYSEDELNKAPFLWKKLFPPKIQDIVASIIKDHQVIKNFQAPWISKNGTKKIFEFSTAVVNKEDNSLDYIALIGIDATEQIQMKNELQKLNQNLQEEIQTQIKELREKEQLLIQQSKLASMGEMIGSIAHQWRQPLNVIALRKEVIVDEFYENELTKEEIDKFQEDMDNTLQYMSKTIDDFRNFFIPSKEKVYFNLIDAINSIVNIVWAQLQNHKIMLKINNHSDKKIEIEGYPNEFKQVIVNLITNSKDAIIKRQETKEIRLGEIFIDLYNYENDIQLDISDNGGGIPNDIITKIFEPYFTTKFQSQGTGLGLYMSKTIIEKNMFGSISVTNIENGAKFTIKLNKTMPK